MSADDEASERLCKEANFWQVSKKDGEYLKIGFFLGQRSQHARHEKSYHQKNIGFYSEQSLCLPETCDLLLTRYKHPTG
jgi:hypothetical protein